MASAGKPNLILRRWRVLLAALAGAGAGAAALTLAATTPGLASLIGWNVGSVVYLVTTVTMLWRDDEATVRRRAAYEDEGPPITEAIVISAVVASLGATVIALHDVKAANVHGPVAPPWAWLLSVSTLLLGWTMVQTVFALRYAHLYFTDQPQTPDRGVKFPGEPPSTYRDFIYMAVCIGASAQVSDFSITTRRFRQLVTFHSLLAFFFNTMILALGINILASVIGGCARAAQFALFGAAWPP
jgi:uncharacterized membrane protein